MTLGVRVVVTKAFLRDLKRLGKGSSRQDDAITSIEQFMKNPGLPKLNFESVKSRKGYHSIRSSHHDRILLRIVKPDEYEAVAIGNHDYIYQSYFRK
jgi:hypothetical protein